MNIALIMGILLAGGTIAFDHLVHELPHWLAVVLYSIAVILFIIGMIIKSKRRWKPRRLHNHRCGDSRSGNPEAFAQTSRSVLRNCA